MDENETDRSCSRQGSTYKVAVGKSDWSRPFGRLGVSGMMIKMNLKEIICM
jgi:hypothetical protein